MKCPFETRQLLLVVLGAASIGPAHALTVPSFNIPGFADTGYVDFINKGLTVDVNKLTSGPNTYYELTATGSGNFTFNYQPIQYGGTSGTYNLTARFNQNGTLTNAYGPNTLSISGAVPASSAGAPTSWSAHSGTLFTADLTAVGYDAANDAVGFQTGNFGGWANQSQFTTGSTVESVYLFDTTGLSIANGGTGGVGALTALINALTAGNLNNAGLLTGTYNNVQSIATVPLPAPLALLGSGLVVLFRRRSTR